MKFPFYNNDEKAYTIDDANFDCGKIIVADCPNNHRYATLCELIEDCPSVKQLTKDCVVNFLNNPTADTKGLDPDRRFVKVKPNGCLEIADPCVCDNGDKYVIATDEDNNPGPLDKKVKGSCSYDGLYCIDIEEAGPQTLVWRPSGPNGPFINPTLPTEICENNEPYNVKLKQSGGKRVVDFECPEENGKPQYAKCTYVGNSGYSSTPCCMRQTGTDGQSYRIGRTVRYYVTRADTVTKPIDSMVDDATSYVEGDWSVIGTEAFAKPTSYGVIKITMPGVYTISFSTYITFHQVMKAIRCGLYANTGSGWYELNDIKYETGEYRYTGMPEVFNRTRPDNWDKEKFVRNSLDSNGQTLRRGALWTLENTGLPFSRTYTLNVNNPTEIAMVVKPDTRGIDPRLIKSQDSDDRYLIKIEGGGDNVYGAVTTIELARVSDVVPDGRFKII